MKTSHESYTLSEFTNFLYKNGLDRAMDTLLIYRVAAEHYAFNPTDIIITDRQWKGKTERVEH